MATSAATAQALDLRQVIGQSYCKEYAMEINGPRYRHDCEACIYLGHHESLDLYACRMDTVIARRSSTPEDYESRPVVLGRGEGALGEAYDRAARLSH